MDFNKAAFDLMTQEKAEEIANKLSLVARNKAITEDPLGLDATAVFKIHSDKTPQQVADLYKYRYSVYVTKNDSLELRAASTVDRAFEAVGMVAASSVVGWGVGFLLGSLIEAVE